jgi:hypothetical protein
MAWYSEFLDKHYEWLNDSVSESGMQPANERGLKPDAPQEAVDSYKEFCTVVAMAKLRGDKL